MKISNEVKKLLHILIIVCLAISFFFLIQNIKMLNMWIRNLLSIVNPFIYGLVIAYLLNRPMMYIENLMEKYIYRGKVKPNLKRIFSVIIIFLMATLIIFLVGSFVVPQLLQSLSLLQTMLQTVFPQYIESLSDKAVELIDKYDLGAYITKSITNLFSSWEDISSYIATWLSQLVPHILNISISISSKILNIILSIVVSIYLLSDKENLLRQFKVVLNALIPSKFVKNIYKVGYIINDTFGQYISGQMVDAVIVGFICSTAMFIFKFPFALLVGIIVCVTNVIPMLGPFIGAIPSTFIILMVDPVKALWFIVLIFILQQVDGNILVPRIVGESTGLSGLWVLFAIVVGGGLFGILGIVLSVPTLSVIFKLFKIFINKRIEIKAINT